MELFFFVLWTFSKLWRFAALSVVTFPRSDLWIFCCLGSICLCRTPPVNSILPVGGRTLCGAPPHCAAWPRPPPPGACRPTWSSPTVPHTFPAASTAHQVNTLNTITRVQYDYNRCHLCWCTVVFIMFLTEWRSGIFFSAARFDPSRRERNACLQHSGHLFPTSHPIRWLPHNLLTSQHSTVQSTKKGMLSPLHFKNVSLNSVVSDLTFHLENLFSWQQKPNRFDQTWFKSVILH